MRRVNRYAVCGAAFVTALAIVVVTSHGQSATTLSTDKTDYSVGDSMHLNGTGYTPNVSINISVLRPDNLTDRVLGTISDSKGSFSASYTPSSPYVIGAYKFTATDGTTSAITASTVAGVGLTLTTDQGKYSVGQPMVISGMGFSGNAPITISILRPDHNTDTLSVTSDNSGAFSTTYSSVNESGRYKITATDGFNSANVAVTQADALKTDFLQCANANPTLGVCDWIPSILQSSDSVIFEGMSTLQRLTFDQVPSTTITNNDMHVLKFHVDATKASSNAYDFITTWDAALAATNALDAIDPPNKFYPATLASNAGPHPACDNPSNPQAALQSVCQTLRATSNLNKIVATLANPGFSINPPDDVTGGAQTVEVAFTDYQAHFSGGNTNVVTMWGDQAFTGPATLTFNGYNSATGDQTANYTLTWTSKSTQLEIEFGAHVAQGKDTLGFGIGYGTNLGAANINGGPYHVSIDSLDGSSIGSEDNQLKGSSILQPPGIVSVSSTLTNAVLDGSVAVGTAVSDTANINAGSGHTIPAGSTVSFQLFNNFSCSGSPISTQSGVAVPSGSQTGNANSSSFTPTAGSYSYMVTFTSGNPAQLTSGPGSCEPFIVVDAKIGVTPATATNEVGQTHVLTATVMQDDGIPVGGNPSPSPAGDGVTGFGPAPDGTVVTFSLRNNAASAAFVNGKNTCTTVNGTCTVAILSSTVGGVDIHASTTFSINGATVTRATGDGLSGDSADAHKNYVDANISITPSATNEVGHQHVFTITVTQLPGAATAATATTITPSFVGTAPGTATNNCGSVNFTGNTASCTLTINSAIVGTFTAHASATMTIGGITVTRASGDGKSGDTADAVKNYVDANVTITPNMATNLVRNAHVFTITATALPGSVTPVVFTSITPSVTPTPDITNSNTCATPIVNGNVATCTLTINSSTMGTFTAHAVAVVTMGGTAVTRATGDGKTGDSADAIKHYVDANISIAPNGTNEVGNPHTFTVTVNQLPGGATPATSANVTYTITPTPPTLPLPTTTSNCGPAVSFSGNSLTCTITINSTTAGVFTAHAQAVINFPNGGPTGVTVATGDSHAGDGPDAVKRYVDASVAIAPSATNPVGQAHTFNVTVTAAPSGATPVSFTITTSVTPTPNVTNTNTCATPIINGNVATCTVTINSSTPGTFTANATAVVTMGSVTVTRDTDPSTTSIGAGPVGTGPAIKTYVAGTIIIRKVTLPAGGTGFGFTASGLTPAMFTLNDGGSQTYANQAPGTYGVSENALTGYDLTSINCAATSGTGTSAVPNLATGSVAITLAANGIADCTFTNTKRGTIVVNKTTVGGTGAFSFATTGAGLSSFPLTTTTAGTAATKMFPNLVTATAGGSRTVTESGPTGGFQFTSLVCSSALGTSTFTPATLSSASQVATISILGPGDTVTCNYVNTAQGTIVVRKTTIGGTGSFAFTTSGLGLSGFPLTTAAANVPVARQFTGLATGATGGSRSIAETNPGPGFVLTGLSCVSAQNTSTVSILGAVATIASLAPGDTVTCDYVNTKQATLIVTKTTLHGNSTFSFVGSASFNLSGGQSTGTSIASFLNIPPGTVKTVTEAEPAGWVPAQPVKCTTAPGGSGTSSVAVNSATSASVMLGAGDTVTCAFVNDLLPTLTIVKTVQGTGTATFTFPVTGANTLSPTITPPPAPGTASFGPVSIAIGNDTISEAGPPAGYTLTDFTCTGYTGGGTGAGLLDSNGVPKTWNFTAGFGDNVVCTFVNNNAQASRTQGFWATHTQLANDVWDGTNPTFKTVLPAGATPVIGSGDEVFGGPGTTGCPVAFTITAIPTTAENILMGGFWAGISQTTTKTKRLSIDQARMQMLQQYLAAVLNYHLFGSIGETVLSTARAAYCGTDQSAIQAQIGILGNLNQNGDNLGSTPGGSATTQTSKAQADLDAWDKPTNPVD